MNTYSIMITPAPADSRLIHLTLFGTKATSAEFRLTNARSVDTNAWQIEVIADLGEMQRIRVLCERVGSGSVPYIEQLVVQQAGTLRTWRFPCRSRFDGVLERMLDAEPDRLAA